MEFKYKCLIVDDEYPAHDVISSLLSNYKNFELVKNCYNASDAIVEINEGNRYDLVFLDINMPIINGIEMLGLLKNKPVIIITTAYSHFAFEAFENDAIDYLQKPIAIERFDRAIKKAVEICKKKRSDVVKTIVLKIDGFATKINQTDIIQIRSMENYSKFFLTNRPNPILVNEPLSKQIEKLDAKLHIQIHRTCIVNKLFIKEKKGNILLLNDNVCLPIGRKFLQSLNENYVSSL